MADACFFFVVAQHVAPACPTRFLVGLVRSASSCSGELASPFFSIASPLFTIRESRNGSFLASRLSLATIPTRHLIALHANACNSQHSTLRPPTNPHLPPPKPPKSFG